MNETFLKWNDDARLHGRARYTGDSRRSQFRKKAAAKQRAIGCTSLDSFLLPMTLPTSSVNSFSAPGISYDNYDDSEVSPILLTIEEALNKLEKDFLVSVSWNRKFDKHSNYDHLRYMSIQRYLLYLLDGLGKMDASSRACLVMAKDPRDYLSRCMG